jgi:hypothetical protein
LNAQEETIGEREHMHRCLVREVIKMRIKDRNGAHRWLNGYLGDRGKWIKGWNELHPESTLEEDVRQQWLLGNRGNEGEWK